MLDVFLREIDRPPLREPAQPPVMRVMLSADRPMANRLLSVLGRADLEQLLPALEEVHLRSRQVLESPGRPIANVYFLESGLVSVLAVSGRDRAVEIGMIGDEGMTGAAAVLGDDRATNRTIVHCPGIALRLPVAALEGAMRDNAALRRRLLHFVHALGSCASQSALALACAKLDERLARWILMCLDRLGSSEVRVTHELLAMVLGVRRPAVTLAMHSLEENGLIRSTRKLISIVDRDGLLKQANGSYGTPEAEYLRLLHHQTASPAAVTTAAFPWSQHEPQGTGVPVRSRGTS